jgi:ParB family chromosome partitioning protein
MLRDGQLSAGHARALLGMENAESVAKRIIAEGLTVRDVEKLAAEPAKSSGPLSKKSADSLKPKPPKDADTRALEKALNDVLGMNVEIAHQGEAGSLTIHYSSLEQLDALCQRLKS